VSVRSCSAGLSGLAVFHAGRRDAPFGDAEYRRSRRGGLGVTCQVVEFAHREDFEAHVVPVALVGILNGVSQNVLSSAIAQLRTTDFEESYSVSRRAALGRGHSHARASRDARMRRTRARQTEFLTSVVDESQQVRIQQLRIGRVHSVWRALVGFQRTVL
jgi:hypothetical protein